jgi:2-amino-4-hydroxy-6-hydroxymethyldihydropteridine diphosphokinase
VTRVYIGIGSNIEREIHIRAALDRLSEIFGALTISPVYESEAIGFDGNAFFNLVVGVDTELALNELLDLLRAIEVENGNIGNLPKFSARSLDLDLLIYGASNGIFQGVPLPRADIVDYAYTLWPLADIAGDELHPALDFSYRGLREQFTSAQKLWPVTFIWRGNDLSALYSAQRAG